MDSKQMRFSDDELNLIKTTFGGNEKLLKLLRKVFLPEYDFNAPLGQVIDLWMTIDVTNLTPDMAYIRLLARNQTISHVEQQIMQLSVLSNRKEETEKEKSERLKKDSTQ